MTVLVSQRSNWPDTGIGSRGADSTFPDRLRAAAEQTNEEPLGLQAKDKILGDKEKGGLLKLICYHQKFKLKDKTLFFAT